MQKKCSPALNSCQTIPERRDYYLVNVKRVAPVKLSFCTQQTKDPFYAFFVSQKLKKQKKRSFKFTVKNYFICGFQPE